MTQTTTYWAAGRRPEAHEPGGGLLARLGVGRARSCRPGPRGSWPGRARRRPCRPGLLTTPSNPVSRACVGGRRQGHVAGDLGGELLDHLARRGDDGRRHLGGVPGAAVGEGGVGHGLLDGGDEVPPWPKAISMLSPVYQVVLGKAVGFSAWSLTRSAWLSTRPWTSPGRSMPVSWPRLYWAAWSWIGVWPYWAGLGVEQVAQVVEEVVARHGEGRGDVDSVPPGVAGAVVEDAGGAVVLAVRRLEGAVVVVGVARADQPGVEGGGGGVELEGGARDVLALDGPVEQGLVVGRVGEGGVLGVGDPPHPTRRVVGRVGRHGVDRPGLGVHHHDRPAGGRRVAAGVVVARLVVGLAQGVDLGGQGVVGHLLEVGVEVGDQVVAGDGRGGLDACRPPGPGGRPRAAG